MTSNNTCYIFCSHFTLTLEKRCNQLRKEQLVGRQILCLTELYSIRMYLLQLL